MAFRYALLPQLEFLRSSLTYVAIFRVQLIISPVSFPQKCPLAKIPFYHPHGHGLKPSSFLCGALIQPPIWTPWHLSSSPQVHSSHRHQDDLSENNSRQVTSLLKDLSWSPVVHRMNSKLLSWAHKALAVGHQLLQLWFLLFSVWTLLSGSIPKHSYQTLILINYINLCLCTHFPTALDASSLL